MGWGRTLLLGDIGNRLDIEDTECDIADLKHQLAGAFRKDMTQDQKIDALVNENAELKLYLASLIRLLLAKNLLTRRELESMVATLDAEDGQPDGRHQGPLL